MDGCTDTLLELLQTYQAKPGDRVADKSAGIFTRACCLLAVLAQTADRASVSTSPSVRTPPGCRSEGGPGGHVCTSGPTGGDRRGRRRGRRGGHRRARRSRQETV